MGRYSRELVSVGPRRHFHDEQEVIQFTVYRSKSGASFLMSDNRYSVRYICRRSLEVSGPRPLEMSVSKNGLGDDERTVADRDRSIDRCSGRRLPYWPSVSGRCLGSWRSTKTAAAAEPRLRRERYGELIQIDGSEHRWFEQRGEPCTLLVFIDDATSQLMRLRFVPSESTDTYFEALRGYLEAHGCPVAFYSDKHTVFRVNRPDAKGGSGMTQFGRALAELNIEIMCANSSQAKGRVERANRTLQDRLVKELRLAGICDIEAGNAFLTGFLDRFNDASPFRRRSLRTCTGHLTLQRAGSVTSCATANNAMSVRSSPSPL